ncbi:cytoglobin-2 [Cetorhinus maximus]
MRGLERPGGGRVCPGAAPAPCPPLPLPERPEKREMESGERPEPDHRLSETDTELIRRTWCRVREDSERAGVRILVRFFSNFPTARRYFRQFQHLQDPQEMQRSVQLSRHAHRVMGAINSLVENLEHPNEIDSILQSVGRAHALRHKVDPVYFKILNGVILEILVEEYSEFFTHEAQEAWTKLLTLIYIKVCATYQEVRYSRTSPSEVHHHFGGVDSPDAEAYQRNTSSTFQNLGIKDHNKAK